MSDETKGYIRGLFMALVLLLAAAVAGWLFAKGQLFSTATAAWVQSVGSILAVMAASQIASRQGREAEQRDTRARSADAERERLAQQAKRRAALALAHIARMRIQALFNLVSDADQREKIKLHGFVASLNNIELTMSAFPIWEIDDVLVIDKFSNIFINIHHARLAISEVSTLDDLKNVSPEEWLRINEQTKNAEDLARQNCEVIGGRIG